jgi:hypothetical protein
MKNIPIEIIAKIVATADVDIDTWTTLADLLTLDIVGNPTLKTMNEFNNIKAEYLRVIGAEFIKNGKNKEELNRVLAFHDAIIY